MLLLEAAADGQLHTTTNQIIAGAMVDEKKRTRDRRVTQGGVHSIVLGPVELGGGEIYIKIKAFVKLIIFLAVLRS